MDFAGDEAEASATGLGGHAGDRQARPGRSPRSASRAATVVHESDQRPTAVSPSADADFGRDPWASLRDGIEEEGAEGNPKPLRIGEYPG